MQEQEEETPVFTEECDIAVTVNGHHYEQRVPVRLLLSDFSAMNFITRVRM